MFSLFYLLTYLQILFEFAPIDAIHFHNDDTADKRQLLTMTVDIA